MAFKVPFDLPPDIAIAQARAQNVVPPVEFLKMTATKRAQAFTASNLAKLDQIQAIADALAKSQANGETFADFQKWAKAQDFGLPKHRLETIYRNAVQQSYNAGHWREFEEGAKDRPYLLFDAINDSRVRPSHLALDGVIRPVGDAYWKTHSPQLAHRCRCVLRSLSREEAMRRGGMTQNTPAEGGPDAGWGANPMDWGRTLRELMREKIAKAPPAVAAIAEAMLEETPDVE